MTDQEAQEQPRKHTKPTRRAWIMRGVVTPIFGLLAVACIVFGVLNSTVWKPSRNITATAQAKPTRRAWIMRGVVTPIFGLLAVACIVFGVLNSTVWKPSRNITATAQAHSTQYVVIDPGVLDLVDTAVTVSADNGGTALSNSAESGTDASEDSQNQQTSQDQQAQTEPQVCMAVGSAKDVSGWLAGEPYVRVTGLSTWQDLSTSEEQAKGTASASQNQVAFGSAKDVSGWLAGEPYVRVTGLSTWQDLSTSEEQAKGTASASQNQVAFADSDMWSPVECGGTSASMHLNSAQPAQVMLIDFGTKTPNADLSMHWVRQRVPDFALPWYFGGGLCAVLAVLSASVFAMEPHTRRKKQAESAQAKPKAAKSADEPTIGAALAGTFAALKPRPKKAGAKGSGRHGRHAGAAEDESRQQGAPTVVDPGARNIVAEHANRNAGGETAEHDAGRGARRHVRGAQAAPEEGGGEGLGPPRPPCRRRRRRVRAAAGRAHRGRPRRTQHRGRTREPQRRR